MTDVTLPRPGPVRRLYDWVLSLAEHRLAGWWLALISFAEASFFPIPPDVLLIPLCLGSTRRALRFATVCSAASVLGGLFGYFIGHVLWDNGVDQLFYRWVIGFTPEKFAHFQEWYAEHGVLVVFAAGFSPIPYKIFTICSGVAGMDLLAFTAASAVGRAGRFFLVAVLLARYGEPMKAAIDRHFNRLALLGTLLLIGGFVALKYLM